MRIFITGGTGFIGKYAVQELVKDGNSLLMLLPESEKVPSDVKASILRGDLANIERLKDEIVQFAPEMTIHLAWEDLPKYDAETSVKNFNYGINLISLMAECGCRTFIGIGSCWEYGQAVGKVSENVPPKPYNAFSAAKNSLHWLGKEIAREKGMGFIWTRLFYAYGPGQRQTSIIPYIVNSVRQGKNPELKTPDAKNDFIFVGDVAKAIAAVVKKPQTYAVYNIGSGKLTNVREILEIICHRFNFKAKYDTLSSKSDSLEFWADISRIKKDTGWQPQISIREGVEETIKYLVGDK